MMVPKRISNFGVLTVNKMINIEDLAFEIDFLPVGEGEKSGDAIALRYGRLNSTTNFYQKVIIVDGGVLDSGKKLIKHINDYYNTNVVDLVINTHPDNDHCSGLREVLNSMDVKELWVHTPWNFAQEYIDLFKDGRITDNSLKERLKEGLNIAYELEQIAKEKKITVREPYTGLTFDSGVITVLNPTVDYYSELLPNFRSTPAPISESVLDKAFTVIKDAINWVAESIHIETLDESGETSAENNSSVISLFNFNYQKILFTGDAGIPALQQSIQYAKSKNIGLTDLCAVQVPHHGSRRNISPSIINELKAKEAYISCAKEGEPKHPSKKVTNAFNRRNIKVYRTKGQTLCHPHNTKTRMGWVSAPIIPFYDLVEE